MQKGQLKIHTENILPIIKKWLYSDKDIFLRELVANANDALIKMSRLDSQSTANHRIDVKVNREERTLQISDNGIGMSAEEVEKYICQIAFSSAEEFLSKYQSDKEGDQIIGHFGLGFYSAYMVSKKVEIQTLSYREGSTPVRWDCDGSPEYTLEQGSRETRGTTITLYLDDASGEYLEENHLKEILDHYCAFFPFPIYLNDKRVNEHEPLWLKSPKECSDRDYLEFYQLIHPNSPAPLFWVHLNVDYPFNLKGILYFPKVGGRIDLKRNTVKLFCNRVFVSDNCKDLIPEYLTVLQGAIDSSDIPLNVSRSYLQMDRTVRQLAKHISKKVSDAMSLLFQQDRKRYEECWRDLALIAKLGAMEDEKFYERIQDCLIWKDSNDAWVTIPAYLEKNSERTGGKVLYTIHPKQAPQILKAYQKKGIDVLFADHPIDTYLVSFLEKKLGTPFKRLDAEVHDSLIDKERECNVLDADGKTEAGRLADCFRRLIDVGNLEIEAKSLDADNLPAIVSMEEEMRRMRDFMAASQPELLDQGPPLFGKRSLTINTNSPLIKAIPQLEKSDPVLAKEMVNEVYELALLSQRELTPGDLNQFIERSQRILENFALKSLSGSPA